MLREFLEGFKGAEQTGGAVSLRALIGNARIKYVGRISVMHGLCR